MIQERLQDLRDLMQKEGIDYYLIPTADFHNSEYVSDYFKVRQYFSGFTGSNGSLLVWQEGAGLWTDGRYFIQAEIELSGSGITLFKMGEEKVPTITSYLEEHMQPGMNLGFDGRVVTARDGMKLQQQLEPKQVKLFYTKDLGQELWKERPEFPHGLIQVLPTSLAGMGTEEKLQQVREKMTAEQVDALFLTKLDDIMWLLNIRGCDVECNPVAMSYCYVTHQEILVFLSPEAMDHEAMVYFGEKSVQVRDYREVGVFLQELPEGKKLWLDTLYCNFTLYSLLKDKMTVVDKKNPTESLKAVKNPGELDHMREIYLKDSVAVTRFIYWLKQTIGKQEITEITAADYLEKMRREIPEFMGLSFPTIAGYNANGAMMHYEATAQKHAVLQPEGLLLVDSGGQYLGGTTDVTRTIALGPLSEEMKQHYTAVAAGMLELSGAVWLQGCSGRNLDILARKPIWELGLDYKCGTGHGVGYMLNVHEGPQSMRWRFQEGQTEAILEEGMDITNEPGIYIEGSHGIRIENVLVVQKAQKNDYGQFLKFETLTWVPLDMQAIIPAQLTESQKSALKTYQSCVYAKISPFLSEEEKHWLRKETRCDF